MNYKKVPYQSVWITFPEVEPTCKSVGAAPTGKKKNGEPLYTVPFIVVTPAAGAGKPYAISDSINIAEFIEKTFPNPDEPYFLTGTRVYREAFDQLVTEKILSNMFPLVIQDFINILTTPEWYEKTREQLLGFPVQNIYPKDEAAVRAYQEKLWEGFDVIAKVLDAGGAGNFRLANGKIIYAEMELASILFFMSNVSPVKIWAPLKDRNEGRWAKLVETYGAWLPRN